jgi:hypothetical protein
LNGSPLGDAQKYYLKLPTDFQLNSSNSVELTFMVNEIQEAGYYNSIYNIGVIGNYHSVGYEPQPDYYIDPNGKIYMEELRANRVITHIDDGSLDWEV